VEDWALSNELSNLNVTMLCTGPTGSFGGIDKFLRASEQTVPLPVTSLSSAYPKTVKGSLKKH